MLDSNDPGFAETKLIKLGKADLPGAYVSLANWIASKYAVACPLNIHFDHLYDGSLPRLNIIFETAEDAARFDSGKGFGFDAAKQAAVRKAAIELNALEHLSSQKQDQTLVIFTDFQRGAREEAAAMISEKDIETIRLQVGGPDVWKVSRIFGLAVVFFESDKDIGSAPGKYAQAAWRKALQSITREYDACRFFDAEPLRVGFDSRENFEKNYNGDWRAYYN